MGARRRRKGGRAALVVGGIAAGLALGEGAARLRAPGGVEGLLSGAPEGVPPDAWQGDDALFQVPVPGWSGAVRGLEYSVNLRFDALGLRGGGVGEARPRVLVLGDSFALAAQVDEGETLTARLGAALGGEGLNAGVDGYSTWQAAGRYARLAPALDPDQVVLLFFLGNDLADNERAPLLAGRRYDPEAPVDRPGWLASHSALVALGRVAWRARALRAGEDPDTRDRYRRELLAFSAEGADVRQRQLEATRDALRALRDATSARGDPLLVAVAPPAFAVNPERAAETMALVGLDPARMDLDAPREAVMALLHELRVPSCDLTEPLQIKYKHSYFIFDGHWTAEGNAVAAEAVAACLNQRR